MFWSTIEKMTVVLHSDTPHYYNTNITTVITYSKASKSNQIHHNNNIGQHIRVRSTMQLIAYIVCCCLR